MTLYELLLFVHISAAIVWIGGAAMHVALVLLARRAGERAQQLAFLHYDDLLGLRLYLPATLVVLAAGIGLVLEGGWDWGQTWIVLGLILFALAFLFGVAYFLPQGKKLHEAIAAHGPDAAEVTAAMQRIYLGAWVDLTILFAAVFVMTVKPGL